MIIKNNNKKQKENFFSVKRKENMKERENG